MPAEFFSQKKHKRAFCFPPLWGTGGHWEWRGIAEQGMACDAGPLGEGFGEGHGL